MPPFLTRRGAGLATVAVGVLCVAGTLQVVTPAFAGYCCLPGNAEAGDSCYVTDNENICEAFGAEEFGQEDVIYDDESYLRCNVACGQNTNFFRCQNRDEVARGVAGPVCLQEQADGDEEGYVYASTCEAACWWNSCDTCEACNYANQYGKPCSQRACEVNPTCIATRLPGEGERELVDVDGVTRSILNQFSCAPKPDSICRAASSSSSSSYSAAYQFEACCVKPPNNPGGSGITYIAASDNDTSMLDAVYGSEDVRAVNYYLSYPQVCGQVYQPYSRVWTDQMPTPQYFEDAFVKAICRSATLPSSASSRSASSVGFTDTKILACCSENASKIVIGADTGGICAPCTDDACGLSACLPVPNDDTTYCGLQNEFTQCVADSQCQSNLCGNDGLCHSCEDDSWCDSRSCNESGQCEGIADGGECLWDDQCASHSCLKDTPDDVSGLCGRLDNGERCTFNDQCSSRHCLLDDPEMLVHAYGDLPVQIEDYGRVQSCTYQPASAFRSFTNAMPTRQFLEKFAEGCYPDSAGYPSSGSPPIERVGKWPFKIPQPPDFVSYNPTSATPDPTVFCDRRVGPIGVAVNALMSITGNMCQSYIKEQHERDLDYYTLFIDDASLLCTQVCPKVRRLSVCISEDEVAVLDTELCAERGDYPLGFPAKMAAGFDELTPDAAGNKDLDKYAYFVGYQAQYELFPSLQGCEILKKYTIDGQPVVPPGCEDA